MQQYSLLDEPNETPDSLVPGVCYVGDYVDEAQEAALISILKIYPLGQENI